MKMVFVGHLSVDINVIKGRAETLYGGGVVHGAVTASRLGAEAYVLTKCAEPDRHSFSSLVEAGVRVTFLPSPSSTSIRNVYPTDNPDHRESTLVSRAAPFTLVDLEELDADVIAVNPLWFGEFPVSLFKTIREKAGTLAADAQGFVRHAAANGSLVDQDFADKRDVLPMLDVFKVDAKEARILTGEEDVRKAAHAVWELGPKTVLLTHKGGVCVHDGQNFYESGFTHFTLEGRTGRGDTCTSAFLYARTKMPMRDATAFAAEITSRKMQVRGPYRG